MNASARTKIERAVLALLVGELATAGWLIEATDDGEGYKKCKTERALFARVFDLDDCYVIFRHGDDKFFNWVRLVRGNDGTDLISDYSYTGRYGFNRVLKRVMKLIDTAPLRFVVKS